MIKRLLAVCSLAVIVGAVAPPSATPAYASSATLLLDCSAGGVSEGDIFDLAPGDDIQIIITAGECDVYLPSQLGTLTSYIGSWTDPYGTLVPEDATFEIALGGRFTVTSQGGSDTAQEFWITGGCPLDGSGVESDPWLVNSAEDFQKIGKGDGETWFCSAEGHYLQTASFTLTDYANDVVTDIDLGDDYYAFSGTYDGDHYTITLGGDWADETYNEVYGLFEYVLGGTLQKIHLNGSLWTNADEDYAGGLVYDMEGPSVISESSVDLDVHLASGTVGFGPVVGILRNGSLLQYSRADGTINWDATLNVGGPTIVGGLVGSTAGRGVVENYAQIRDSYSSMEVTWAEGRDLGEDLVFGGILGHVETETVILRTYSVSSVVQYFLDAANVYGIVGDDFDNTVVLSSFYRDAAGDFDYAGESSLTWSGYGEGVALPYAVAAGSTMTTIFQYTQRGETGIGPSISPDDALPVGASDPDDLAPDLRWAIEVGNVSVFIPQLYENEVDYATRYLHDPDESMTYQMRGTNLEGSATGYPVLGRVWEICADQYPTLVWELENCGESGGGSGGSDDDDEDNPYGMSDEEYAAFLASGLTYEQFIAARLAATGVSPALAPLGFGAGALLVAFGLAVLALRRRLTAGR